MEGSDEDASSSSEDKLKEEINEEDFEQQHFLEPQVRVAPILFRKKEAKIRFVKLIYFCFSKNKFCWIWRNLTIFRFANFWRWIYFYIGDNKTRRYLSVMRRSLKVTLSRPTLWIIWNFQFGTFSVWRRSQRKFFRQNTSFLVQVYYLQLKKSI